MALSPAPPTSNVVGVISASSKVVQSRKGMTVRLSSPTHQGYHPGSPPPTILECLSLCVSLAQREFALPGRDCRTTKIRKRDARAAIAANAARIRLCVKTVVARLAQSPGTSGRIAKQKSQKHKTGQILSSWRRGSPPNPQQVCLCGPCPQIHMQLVRDFVPRAAFHRGDYHTRGARPGQRYRSRPCSKATDRSKNALVTFWGLWRAFWRRPK